ncbi:unnamed protein product [Ectocarpus fasciculatus]
MAFQGEKRQSSLGMMTPAPDPWPTSEGSGSCCTSGRDDSSLEPRVSATAKRTSTICYRWLVSFEIVFMSWQRRIPTPGQEPRFYEIDFNANPEVILTTV